MKAQLVRIGNSRGIRIPKPILKQCGFKDTVDVRVEHRRMVIVPARPLRQGWEEAFRAAGGSTSDEWLLDSLHTNEFDREEWQW